LLFFFKKKILGIDGPRKNKKKTKTPTKRIPPLAHIIISS
jgi:hypothetical protein